MHDTVRRLAAKTIADASNFHHWMADYYRQQAEDMLRAPGRSPGMSAQDAPVRVSVQPVDEAPCTPQAAAYLLPGYPLAQVHLR